MTELIQVYGMHAVRSLLRRQPDRVRRLLLDAKRDDPRMRELQQLAGAAAVKIERVDAKQLAGRVGDVTHQGVVAEVTPLSPWGEDELVAAIVASSNPLVLVLDSVQDPHNLGACLRTRCLWCAGRCRSA